MTTHEKFALLWLLVMSMSVTVGWLLGHWRAYAECCDCCTCEDCGGIEEDEPVLFRKLGRGIGGSFDEHGEIIDQWHRDGPDQPKIYDAYDNSYGAGDAVSPGRRTVVLEPGPTIYRALVPLDDESLYGPESHVKPADSTFIRTVLMDWERRYPIPRTHPTGTCKEAPR